MDEFTQIATTSFYSCQFYQHLDTETCEAEGIGTILGIRHHDSLYRGIESLIDLKPHINKYDSGHIKLRV